MPDANDAVRPQGAPSVDETAERSRTVEREDIRRFTEISGDRNPLHYDEEVARATQFGEIVVQGGITSAILIAVVAEELPGAGTVFLNVDWDFPGPAGRATRSQAPRKFSTYERTNHSQILTRRDPRRW